MAARRRVARVMSDEFSHGTRGGTGSPPASPAHAGGGGAQPRPASSPAKVPARRRDENYVPKLRGIHLGDTRVSLADIKQLRKDVRFKVSRARGSGCQRSGATCRRRPPPRRAARSFC